MELWQTGQGRLRTEEARLNKERWRPVSFRREERNLMIPLLQPQPSVTEGVSLRPSSLFVALFQRFD